jgi:phage FluMu protein Com
MPIELNCAGCGQLLRVADEHAGKKARCPACGTIADVPQVASPASWAKEPDRPWQETPSFAKMPTRSQIVRSRKSIPTHRHPVLWSALVNTGGRIEPVWC